MKQKPAVKQSNSEQVTYVVRFERTSASVGYREIMVSESEIETVIKNHAEGNDDDEVTEDGPEVRRKRKPLTREQALEKIALDWVRCYDSDKMTCTNSKTKTTMIIPIFKKRLRLGRKK